MSAQNLERIIRVLREYVHSTGAPLDVLLIGRMALHAYGVGQPETDDLDAELTGDIDQLMEFLKQRQVPANLSENISGWSVIAMPPGYRDRGTIFLEEPGLRLRLLAPVDYVIAKLRRGTDQDQDDAFLVARRFGIPTEAVQHAAEQAIANSPRDTALFLFRKTAELFGQRLRNG